MSNAVRKKTNHHIFTLWRKKHPQVIVLLHMYGWQQLAIDEIEHHWLLVEIFRPFIEYIFLYNYC